MAFYRMVGIPDGMGVFDNHDGTFTLLMPFAALPHGSTFAEDRFPGFSYTMTHNLTGWPVVVVRGGTTREGLPIGVQVAGRPWQEDQVLAVGRALEACFGDWPRPPS